MHARLDKSARMRFGALALSVSTLFTLSASGVSAYTQDPYNSANNTMQAKNCWCVVGSTVTWLKYISGSTVDTQANVSTYLSSHDKYPGQTGYCSNDGSYGHDPRGWAWGMWHYTPAGYGFNDYINGSGQSQAVMNWEFVKGVRATNQPVGAVVVGGRHVVLIVGYKTLNDPFSSTQQTLYGFYIWDPWYGRGDSGMTGWGTNRGGYPGNYYVAIGTWNAAPFYTPDYINGAYYSGHYDAVLRASTSAQPSDNPPISYGDSVYSLSGFAVVQPTEASSTASPSIRESVIAGMKQNGLEQ